MCTNDNVCMKNCWIKWQREEPGTSKHQVSQLCKNPSSNSNFQGKSDELHEWVNEKIFYWRLYIWWIIIFFGLPSEPWISNVDTEKLEIWWNHCRWSFRSSDGNHDEIADANRLDRMESLKEHLTTMVDLV